MICVVVFFCVLFLVRYFVWVFGVIAGVGVFCVIYGLFFLYIFCLTECFLKKF